MEISITLVPRFSGLDGVGTCPHNEKAQITQMYLCNANMNMYIIIISFIIRIIGAGVSLFKILLLIN